MNATQNTSSTRQTRTRQRQQQHQRPYGEQADHKAANATMHQPNHCRNNVPTISRPHASRPTLNQLACKCCNGHGIPQVADTMVRTARGQPYPRTQQNSANLPLYNQPTNCDELLRTPSPLEERKLDRVRRREHASQHASPEARASSSRLTPTETNSGGAACRTRPLAWPLAPVSQRRFTRRCDRAHPHVSCAQRRGM